MTERFEAANKGIKLEYVPVQAAEWDEYYGKIVTMLAAGQQLDLTEVSTEGMHLSASKEIIQPIDSLVQAEKAELQEYFSDVAPALIEAMMYKGSLYLLPQLHGTAVLFYNNRVFKAAGVERPSDDWTTEQFLDISKKITASKPGTYAFGRPNAQIYTLRPTPPPPGSPPSAPADTPCRSASAPARTPHARPVAA